MRKPKGEQKHEKAKQSRKGLQNKQKNETTLTCMRRLTDGHVIAVVHVFTLYVFTLHVFTLYERHVGNGGNN